MQTFQYMPNGNITYDFVTLYKRMEMLKKVHKRKGITHAEAFDMAKSGIDVEIERELTKNESHRIRFQVNKLLRFWNGRITPVTNDEIMGITMVYDFGTELQYHRSNVCKLARLFQKREGLKLSNAMEHAWFWARRQMKDIKGEFSIQKFEAKRQSRIAYANRARQNQESPEESSYHQYMTYFKIWQREFRNMISTCENSAPRGISKHWVCNPGNIFEHPKYGQCLVKRHKAFKAGWFLFYSPVGSEKEYKLEISKFRGLSRGLQYPITEPINKDCLTNFGQTPLYAGPDI